MIVSRYLRRLCGLLAGVTGLLAPDASAQNTLPAAEGDVFLCFRATAGLGATTDYMVNIGSVTQFKTTGNLTVDLGGSIAGDLEAIYGESWFERADVLWSVSGVQKFQGNGFTTNNNMFASRAQTVPGTQSAGFITESSTGQSQPALRMVSMREAYALGTREDNSQTKSTLSTKALVQSVSAQNSYRSYMPGGANTVGNSTFGTFNVTGGIEATFASGPASSVVDFYQLVPNTGPALLLGGFRLNASAGVAALTFSSDITIFQGPALVNFEVDGYPVSEDVVGGKVTLKVVRTGKTDTAFTLNLNTADGSANAGTDYVAHTNTIVAFASGETSKDVDVTIVSRPGFQGNRSFTATLSVATGTPQLATPSVATINIVETTPQPAFFAFSAATYNVAENVTSGNVTVTVNRTGADTATSVKFATQNGTAIAGEDFTAQSNVVLNFAIGEESKNVDVAIIPRTGFQGNRTFNVVLSAPAVGGELGTPATATVTIQENEPNPAGTVAFSSNAFNFAAGGQNSILIGLNRTTGATGAIAVAVSIAAGGTLTAGEDFTFTSPKTVNFADGQSSATVEIVLNPAAAPLPGTFNLELTNPANGATIGTPSAATVTITTAAPFDPKGIYTGLITPIGTTTPGGNLNNASGLISVNVTSTGIFSGKLLIAGATIPIRGTFGSDRIASFKPALTPTVLLATKGKNAVVLGELSLGISPGTITGAIGTIATIDAVRAAFDGKTPATTPDSHFLQNKGKHTAVFPSKAQAVLTSSQFPQGDGAGGITITKAGKVTFKGKLADGTPVSMSAPLSADLEVPLFAQLYAKKGSIGGIVTLDKTEPDSDLAGTDFLWLRPAIATAKQYPAGWVGGVQVDLVGTRYAVPPASSVLLVLNSEDPVAGNATLQAVGLTETVVKNVNVSTKNKVTNVPPTDKTFKVTIAAPTGAISGFFAHAGTKTKFNGVILQKGANKAGFGYFLTTAPGESGAISLSKN